MTESQKLQQELNKLNAERAKQKAENSVADDFPVINRGFSHRKSISIVKTGSGLY